MQEHDNQLAEWQEAPSEQETVTTLSQMDNLIKRLKAAKKDYEDKKDASSEAHKVMKDIEAQVIDALKANRREKYAVDGYGTAYIISKETYKVPGNNDDKLRLFEYIKTKYGHDTLTSLQGINSMTLNSWANKESESGVMSIPGLEAPTLVESLGFRKG